MHYLTSILDKLKEHEVQLNNINVFPIADKDTGTNLFKTLNVEVDATNFRDFLFKLSDKVLYSARGSSGNILALYLLGLKENYNDNIVETCKGAAQFTWNTMYEPQEGTILTAMKAYPTIFEGPKQYIGDFYNNVLDCLMRGPDLLPILKQHNTIDSGTLGFTYILQGLYEAIVGESLPTPELTLSPVDTSITPEEKTYCVELLLGGNHKEELGFLKDYGDELIILTLNNEATKLHIHTDNYQEVIRRVEGVAQIKATKVDNMKEQGKA